ncbi:MAG: hypothetical protein [Caudoviricetes sp.]|nr:MAG: hypothetical protein [Caudoviricetes sp.]
MAKRKDYDANWKVWFPAFILEGRGNVKGMIRQTFRNLPAEVQKELLKDLIDISEAK